MAQKIPTKYRHIVKAALIGAAGVAPLGLFGALDTAGIATIWTTMFLGIKEEANTKLGADPKRICAGVASGIARYYLGCKAATYACFLIPGVGLVLGTAAAIGISAVCNIYFTYTFAATLIELFEKNYYDDGEITEFFINHLKKLPNKEEVAEIREIYQFSW